MSILPALRSLGKRTELEADLGGAGVIAQWLALAALPKNL